MTPVAEKKSTHPSDPPHRGNPSNPGEGEAAQAQPKPTAEGIAPAAATPGLTPITTNFSVAPGPVWFEFTNKSAISVAFGHTGVVTVTLPLQGAAGTFLTQFLEGGPGTGLTWIPLGVIVLAPPVDPDPIPTLPVPQFPNPLANSQPGLPDTVGVHGVTITPTVMPDGFSAGTLTIHLVGSVVSSIPANRRWLIFSMTGV